jgi:hypothetical protein
VVQRSVEVAEVAVDTASEGGEVARDALDEGCVWSLDGEVWFGWCR